MCVCGRDIVSECVWAGYSEGVCVGAGYPPSWIPHWCILCAYVSPCRKVCVVRLTGGGVEEQRTTPGIGLSGDTLVRSHGWVVMDTAA